MSTVPKTVRDALLAEMLGDLDGMLSRIEKLPLLVAECERRMAVSAARLEKAGEKYGTAVHVFTEEAKEELSEFLDQKAAVSAEKQADDIKQVLRAEKGVIQKNDLPGLFWCIIIALSALFFMFLLVRFVP